MISLEVEYSFRIVDARGGNWARISIFSLFQHIIKSSPVSKTDYSVSNIVLQNLKKLQAIVNRYLAFIPNMQTPERHSMYANAEIRHKRMNQKD